MCKPEDYNSLPLVTWYITLEHDAGTTRFAVPARTKEFAVKRLLDAENAPQSAVIDIEEGEKISD